VITLQVDLGERSYPIHIGAGLLGRADLLVPFLAGEQVLLVSNETVAPLYRECAAAAFAGYQLDSVVLPDGEEFKTLEVAGRIFDALMLHRHARTTTLVALGGGVVGDMAGFAAACYQRGVAFIQLPTTLLAQVDSSVGGKTGVNHPLGKNMIGAFHQPRCVVIDTATLETLDGRQLRAGLAEVVKYGLIRDAEFFAWLERNLDALLARDPAALAYAIERSCWHKAQVVAADEREAGSRALLNLGHTFGHAIETGTGYGRWLHGEAVAIGMVMAAELSRRVGWLNREDVDRIKAILVRANLPSHLNAGLEPERFRALMAVDKKVRHGRLRLVLLQGIGQAVVSDEFDESSLEATLAAACAGPRT
jgi:3-dehydroquinate synthase